MEIGCEFPRNICDAELDFGLYISRVGLHYSVVVGHWNVPTVKIVDAEFPVRGTQGASCEFGATGFWSDRSSLFRETVLTGALSSRIEAGTAEGARYLVEGCDRPDRGWNSMAVRLRLWRCKEGYAGAIGIEAIAGGPTFVKTRGVGHPCAAAFATL